MNSPDRAGKILVVDDEPDLLILYELALLREGHQVVTAPTVTEARLLLEQQGFDLLVTDMRLPDGQGLELVAYLNEHKRAEQAIVITAYGSADSAVQALKLGAFDYLTKPVDLQRFRAVVRDAIDGTRYQREPARAHSKAASAPTRQEAGKGQSTALDQIVGDSEAIQLVRARVRKVAVSMAPVLLQGESGTGKELVARAIHDCSHRASGPFVAVNCGAIPETLLEAEFFGAKKGAYTGAQQDREGFFQAATGGTLFLDEIGDLPLTMQSKLLRAIQERCIRPLGSSQEVPVDVRVVSATHKHLDQEVAAGRFRQDLYYRLNVIELALPPLRERRADLPQLVIVLLKRIGRASGQTEPACLSESALQQLQDYDFPGNVRELENILHRACALCDGQNLELDDVMVSRLAARPPVLPEAAFVSVVSEGQAVVPDDFVPERLEEYLNQQEKRILLKVLQDTDFNRTAAAHRLGISLRQIRYRMDRLQIHVPGTGSGN